MTEKVPGTAKDDAASKPDFSRIRISRVGVWKVYVEKAWTGGQGFTFPMLARPKEVLVGMPYVFEMFWRVASLGYLPVFVTLACSLFSATRSAVDLYCSAQLLDVIQRIVMKQEIAQWSLIKAIVARLLCIVASWIESTAQSWSDPILETRVSRIVDEMIFEARLRLDHPTSELDETRAKFEQARGSGWRQLNQIIGTFVRVLELFSQILFTLTFFANMEDGINMALICVAQPVINTFMQNFSGGSLWFAHVDSLPWSRLKAIRQMGTREEYHKDIIGSGLQGYLHQEYYKARKTLGDTPDQDPWNFDMSIGRSLQYLTSMVLSESPMFLLALRAYQNPSSFSMSSIAMIQETTGTFRNTLWGLIYDTGELWKSIRSIKALFDILEIKNTLNDGQVSYPPPQVDVKDNVEVKPIRGMEIEFRNVSLTHPGGDKPALRNVSWTIPAGALVIIVGENGSGKTSTVSLLNRLIDPSEGEVFVDGRNIKEYRMTDLRMGSAILFQEYYHYSLTLEENIGIGNPYIEKDNEDEKSDDGEKGVTNPDEEGKEKGRRLHRTKIMHAAGLAGAKDMIEALPKSFDTNLSIPSHRSSWEGLEGTEVEKVMNQFTKPVHKFSGGQWQRLALARTFMRALSDNVRLVCCDEPSAALDPRAESEVFERLRTAVDGKTRIFITHRFGHLTKHADLILCMKDGQLEEQGTHAELMEKGGEYSKLYNIQAEAFA